MQKELNLTVGQKYWSIQLGECEVISIIDQRIRCKPIHKSEVKWMEYEIDGKLSSFEFSPSLFESNPFEPKLVQEHKDGWIEPKGNNAELIRLLIDVSIIHVEYLGSDIIELSKVKLKKLLESI